jgi:hypothetical protein
MTCPSAKFFVTALVSLRHQVVSFIARFTTNRIAKTFATDSRSVHLSIEVVVNSGNYLKTKLFFDYPQLWIKLFVTTIISF